MKRQIHIGLTGGIGSGKSTVGGMLTQLGARVIDADAISRQTTANGGAAIEAIRTAFGDQFITPEGALDRSLMRTKAFKNPQIRRQLEAIVHPLVASEIQRLTLQAKEENNSCIVYDVPLLVESLLWRARVGLVLVIDCSPETQIERTRLRSGLSTEAIQAIIDAQCSRSLRLSAADMVICNDGLSLQALSHEVSQLAPRFGL